MKEEEGKEPESVKLRVKKSPISGSGIARVNLSVMDRINISEGKTAIISSGKKSTVVRLVADERMDRGRISIRRKDLIKLRVREGDEVELTSFKKAVGKKFSFLRR